MARVPDNKNLNITQITIKKAKEEAAEIKMGTVYVLSRGLVSHVNDHVTHLGMTRYQHARKTRLACEHFK